MRKLVVHLGPHKSGSTSFQADLVAKRAAFASAGVFVPLVEGSANCESVSRELLGKPARTRRLEGALERFKGDIISSDADTILASSEHFELSLRNGRALDRLVHFAKTIDATIVVVGVVRDNASYMNGWYQQTVRGLRERRLFAPWFEEAVAFPRFDYTKSFRQVINHPKIDFRAVPFSQATERGITDAILAEGGISLPGGVRRSTWENRSIGPRSVALLRRIATPTAFGISRGFEAARTRKFVSWQIIKATNAAGWNASPFWGFDQALLEQAQDYFAQSNERFAQLMWGHAWPERPPTDRVCNEVVGLRAR